MKKPTFIIPVIALMILLFLTSSAFAGRDSQCIQVSCRIPEVPGLNAPLIEEESASVNDVIEESEKSSDKVIKQASLIQQENENRFYTIYAR